MIIVALQGSRGDVQPGLALARELQRRGHELVVGVPPNLTAPAKDLGLDPVPMGPDSQLLLRSDLVQRRTKTGNPVARFKALRELGTFWWSDFAADLSAQAEQSGADAIVTCFLGQEVARAVAQQQGIAQLAMHYAPTRPARSVSLLQVPPPLHNALWRVLDLSWTAMTRRGEAEVYAQLGLPAPSGSLVDRMAAAAALEVQAYDPLLFPGLEAEWGARRPLVGFLDLDDADHAALHAADPELNRWLDRGTPPVYWGFGSMPVAEPSALAALVRTVSADLGVRSLVCAGWSDLPDAQSETVRVVPAVNHRAVLPRCLAAVHHGGAGTTAAALRAGIPSLVAWFSADQPFWGRRLAERQIGAVHKFRDLTAADATAALATLIAEPTRARARRIRDELIPPQQAVAQTADLVELATARHARLRKAA